MLLPLFGLDNKCGWNLVFFILAEPANFESISIFGSSLKLREIKHTITELRQLSQITARSILNLEQCQGRFALNNEDQKLIIYKEVEDVLRAVNIPSEKIEEIQEKYWHSWVRIDYIYGIINSNNINHPNVPKENIEEWHKKRREIIKRSQDIQPHELKKIFQDLNALSPELVEIIEDFSYYLKNKKHRNLNRWKRRDTWFSGKVNP